MIAAMAQWEREEIASRIAASVPIRARLGKQIGGEASFGYKWENKYLAIDEKEAPVRKLLYELFLKLKRKKAVARELNDLGYRTRKGAKFSNTTTNRLLRDPTAKGQHIANHITMNGTSRIKGFKPEAEWIITSCPAIVSEELWNECNRLLDEQAKKRSKPGPRGVHLLSGFLHCGCGKKMYVYHKDNMYHCQKCGTKIAASDIDEIYHEQLREFLLTEVDVSTYLAKNESYIAEKETLLSATQEEAGRIRKRMTELVTMRLGNELGRDAFVEHHRPLEERLTQITDQLPELEAEIAFLKVENESSDTVLQEARTLYEKWPTMLMEEKRTIVETITESITLEGEDISIKLSYAPASFQNSGKRQHAY